MTRKELIQVLQSGDENQQVMISGYAATAIDIVPAMEGSSSYLSIVGQQHSASRNDNQGGIIKELEVTELALIDLLGNLNKASSVTDLVRQQLEEEHEGRSVVTTNYQLMTLLEFVDNLLMSQIGKVNNILGITAS